MVLFDVTRSYFSIVVVDFELRYGTSVTCHWSCNTFNSSLLPDQMLLFAGHIDEAVNELEKFGHSSQAALPLR